MRFILKPGGLALIIVVGILLFVAVLQTSRQTKQLVSQPVATATPVSTPGSAEHPSWPYTMETPVGTLQSGDFETDYEPVHPYQTTGVIKGELARHWYDDSSWAPVTLTYAQSPTKPHSGNGCQEIHVEKNTTDGAVQMVQTLKLVSGKRYTAGIWLRAERPTKITLQLREAGSPFTAYGTTDAVIGPEWQQVTTSGVIGTDSLVYFYLKISTSDITVWVDDATLDGPQ